MKYIKLILVLVAIFASVYLLMQRKNIFSFSIGQEKNTDFSSEQIEQIHSIRQWEFLTINAEEYVDTTISKLLSTKSLVRIYKGTIRLGIDMTYADSNWFSQHSDTVSVALPDISLLDSDFLNEASAVTFYEKGTWKPSDYEVFLDIARRQMLQRYLTDENIDQARVHARKTMTELFQSLGYRVVMIRFV